jgi:hypothetical protein
MAAFLGLASSLREERARTAVDTHGLLLTQTGSSPDCFQRDLPDLHG